MTISKYLTFILTIGKYNQQQIWRSGQEFHYVQRIVVEQLPDLKSEAAPVILSSSLDNVDILEKM